MKKVYTMMHGQRNIKRKELGRSRRRKVKFHKMRDEKVKSKIRRRKNV